MRVFISYSGKDHRLLHLMVQALVEVGLTPVVAAQERTPGARLDAKVVGLIRKSDAVVAILTTRAAKAQWVQQELGTARAQRKLIVPLRTRNVRPMAMLEGYEYTTFTLGDPMPAFGMAAGYLRQYATSHGKPVATGGVVPDDGFQIMHLPFAVVCPRCKTVGNHVFLCYDCGDWVCPDCGETVPPSARVS
jgi:hypothetical protein